MHTRRPIDFSGAGASESKQALMERLRVERESRATLARQTTSATIIQRATRRLLAVVRAREQLVRMYDEQWTAYTTLLSRRSAALKEHPMLESTLFPSEGEAIGKLVTMRSLVTKHSHRRNRAAVAASDDMKLLSLCAAIVKSSMDRTGGGGRHNYFYCTPTTAAKCDDGDARASWVRHCQSLVSMLLDRLTRDSTRLTAGAADVKSFGLIASCLCITLDPSRWSATPTSTATSTPSSPTASASTPAPELSHSRLTVYTELLARLLVHEQLFARLRELLLRLLCCSAQTVARAVTSSSSASSSSSPSAEQRPAAIISALLTSCFRVLEIASSINTQVAGQSSARCLLPNASYLFAAHILPLPSLHSYLTPALISCLARTMPGHREGSAASTVYSVSYFALHQLLLPRQRHAVSTPFSLTAAEWTRLNPLLPLWARDHQVSTLARFNSSDVHANVPAPVHLLATLLSLTTTYFPLARLVPVDLHRFVDTVGCLVRAVPHALLALVDSGRFEFDSPEDEAAARRDVGPLVDTSIAVQVRRELLANLEVLFRQSTITAVLHHVFTEGHRLSDEDTGDGSASEDERFLANLRAYTLVDASEASNRVFLGAFRTFTRRHVGYFASLITLFKSMYDLRSARRSSGGSYAASRILRTNGMSALSFSTPFLPCLFEEMSRRIGCELSEGVDQQQATTERTRAAHDTTSPLASIRTFFGLSGSEHSARRAPIVVTNRNRWESAILTERNYDSSGGAVVTDLYLLFLSTFQPLLFVLEDDELLRQLPGIAPQTIDTLVALVHLTKTIVFRLIFNKYERADDAHISFADYEDLLQPAQQMLREMYARDARRHFMTPPGTNAGGGSGGQQRQKRGAYESLRADPVASSSSSSVSEPTDDAARLESRAQQWLLSSGGDKDSRAEIDTFYSEFELWADGSAANDPTAAKGSLADPSSPQSQRLLHILHALPFVLSFSRRVSLLRAMIRADSWQYGYRPAGQQQLAMYELVVRRQHIFEDGLVAVGRMGHGFKQKLRVKFVDAQSGAEEAGIDLGGPFKELLESICKEVFRVDYGLFTRTPLTTDGTGGAYYPSPSAPALHPDASNLFRNIGRVVGKALYEGILLDIPLATFFLNRFISQPSVISDLAALDQQLYDNLMVVKRYTGDVADLGLTFTVDANVMGRATTVDLIAGGGDVEVTNQNRTLYIYKLAHYHLHTNLAPVVQPFMSGLSDMVDLRWFQMFNTAEMRMVLSGSSAHEIDVTDWQAHTHYEECSANSRVISWFWELMASSRFSAAEKSLLLRFTTSCSRAPLQGFKELQPPFTIRLVPVQAAAASEAGFFARMFSSKPSHAQLPSAATCFNTLKLPRYSSKSVLESKLKLAIQNATGFHLA